MKDEIQMPGVASTMKRLGFLAQLPFNGARHEGP